MLVRSHLLQAFVRKGEEEEVPGLELSSKKKEQKPKEEKPKEEKEKPKKGQVSMCLGVSKSSHGDAEAVQ